MSSETGGVWEPTADERIIGAEGEAATKLKSVIDRRWDEIADGGE
jgi:hypothetical protein